MGEAVLLPLSNRISSESGSALKSPVTTCGKLSSKWCATNRVKACTWRQRIAD